MLERTPYGAAGTFTSRVADAGGPADWGAVVWTASLPAGTTLALSARTGNNFDLLGVAWQYRWGGGL